MTRMPRSTYHSTSAFCGARPEPLRATGARPVLHIDRKAIAADAGHVRLGHGEHRGGADRRIDRVAAGLQRVDRRERRQRMRASPPSHLPPSPPSGGAVGNRAPHPCRGLPTLRKRRQHIQGRDPCDAYIYDGLRTPIGRHAGALAPVRPDDLLAGVIKAVVERNPFKPADYEDAIVGCTNQAGEDARNVARHAALLGGLPIETGGLTVNRLCGSGLAAVLDAARAATLRPGRALHRRRRREHEPRALRHGEIGKRLWPRGEDLRFDDRPALSQSEDRARLRHGYDGRDRRQRRARARHLAARRATSSRSPRSRNTRAPRPTASTTRSCCRWRCRAPRKAPTPTVDRGRASAPQHDVRAAPGIEAAQQGRRGDGGQRLGHQ